MPEVRDELNAIERFNKVMLEKLRENSNKPHWSTLSYEEAYDGLMGEVTELRDAIYSEDYQEVAREAADVANFAMFIALRAVGQAEVEGLPLVKEAKDPIPNCFGTMRTSNYTQTGCGECNHRYDCSRV